MNQTTDNQFLQDQDIETIRNILPYGWRLQIQQAHPQLTTRQITETFNLRTRNEAWAEIVFTTIAKILDDLNMSELATKCRNRIAICKAANVPMI